MRYSDLVLELVELCRDIRSDLTSTLAYYRASAYKRELADKIKVKVDHLRAVFQILGDDELSDAMATRVDIQFYSDTPDALLKALIE